MKRIRFFSWGNDDYFLQDIIDTWGCQKYKDIEFVKDNYTHAVILNKQKPVLNIPKSNVIGLTHEPRSNLFLIEDDINHIYDNMKTYYIDDISGLPLIFKSGQGYISNLYGKLKDKHFEHNNNKITMIASYKTWREGHRMRHSLIKEILKTDMQIDIWGDRIKICFQDDRIKGNFIDHAEIYENYKYIIVIESDKTDYYVSEKFTNAIAYECIPIYWGCNKIREMYSDKILMLNNDISYNMKVISDIYHRSEIYQVDVKRIKKDIYGTMQYLPEFLYQVFQ